MYYAGIDPGATGAIAIIDDKGIFQQSMKFEDWPRMAAFLMDLKKHEHLAVLEKIHAIAGDARRVKSLFAFGKNCGGWEALLKVLGISHILVSPQSWQPKLLGRFKAGTSKEAAHAYVVKRFPDLGIAKSNTGLADALCLALYGKMQR